MAGPDELRAIHSRCLAMHVIFSFSAATVYASQAPWYIRGILNELLRKIEFSSKYYLILRTGSKGELPQFVVHFV